MKTKKLDKKLTLNRRTITNLDQKQMKRVNGGVPPVLETEEKTCDTNCRCDM